MASVPRPDLPKPAPANAPSVIPPLKVTVALESSTETPRVAVKVTVLENVMLLLPRITKAESSSVSLAMVTAPPTASRMTLPVVSLSTNGPVPNGATALLLI